MRKIVLITVLVFLLSCATAPKQPVHQASCAWPEIPSDSGCCRDLNGNGVCDTVDFAQEIEAEQQQEYEEAAEQARETAEQAGRLRRTIVNDLYDSANNITDYRFLYKGDEVVVTPAGVVRRLLREYQLGDRDIDGRRYKVVVNTILLDNANRTATGQCVPSQERIKQEQSTPCDAFAHLTFDLPYDHFAFTLPIEWLESFLNRRPYDALPGSHVGKLQTTLYRFTDLKDAHRRTNLWVDEATKMPLRVEVWQDDELVQHEEYLDLSEMRKSH